MERVGKFYVRLRRPPRCIADCPAGMETEEMAQKRLDLDGLRELLSDEGIVIPESVTEPMDFLNHLHTSLLSKARMEEAISSAEDGDEGDEDGYHEHTPVVVMSEGGPLLMPAKKRKRCETREQVDKAVDDFFGMLPGASKKEAALP